MPLCVTPWALQLVDKLLEAGELDIYSETKHQMEREAALYAKPTILESELSMPPPPSSCPPPPFSPASFIPLPLLPDPSCTSFTTPPLFNPLRLLYPRHGYL